MAMYVILRFCCGFCARQNERLHYTKFLRQMWLQIKIYTLVEFDLRCHQKFILGASEAGELSETPYNGP